MAVTIEQEKKALEKIENILKSLCEESYVAKAFEGCSEIAAANIADDFWNSYKDMYVSSQRKIDEYKKVRDELVAENQRLKDNEYCLKNTIDDLKKQVHEETMEALNERKELTIELANGEKITQPFAEIRYINNDGFAFVTVAEKSGWMTSYKMEDIDEIKIA